MIRVVVVDDHQLFAEGLATSLNALPDIDVIASFTDGSSFLALLPTLDIEVLLLDLEMPAISGTDILSALNASVKTIIVSMHTGHMERARAFELGAAGFLSKAAPLTDLAAAIRAVNDGRNLSAADTTLRGVLDEFQAAQLDPGAASLTHREREILSMMARGVTATDELSEALFISQKTVKNHLANIYEKLAISDRAQAALEAIRLGFGKE